MIAEALKRLLIATFILFIT